MNRPAPVHARTSALVARDRNRCAPRRSGLWRARHAAALGVCAIVGGCATVDFDTPRKFSTAIEPALDTYLGRRVAEAPPTAPDESGFYVLIDGIEALAARLKLAERAERTLDVQYYLIHDDITGNLFLADLLAAADRGVRVRLLLDDIFTQGYDTRFWLLDAHPNFEIRLFNPFATRTLRYLWSLASLRRVNRRMHNKSFTVDNLFTVIGGRNIGDEYFGAREDQNFGDLDLVCVGPVVQEVSTMFDAYWNDRLAVPVSVLVQAPRDPQREERELREHYVRAFEAARSTRYKAALDLSAQDLVAIQAHELEWSRYQLVYDPPAKARVGWADEEESILTPLREALDATEHELLLISPYFVPRARGIERFARLRERGVEVRVLTNSLAANNQAIVHSGYAPARRPLLDLGVELYEVRPDAAITGLERVGHEASRATLHTKAFMFDRTRLFVGSFNWDPRSFYINTEMGVILDNPGLTSRLVDLVDAALPEQTYRVEINGKGELLWTTLEDGEEVVYSSEPETSCWRRFVTGVMRLLPIKDQL